MTALLIISFMMCLFLILYIDRLTIKNRLLKKDAEKSKSQLNDYFNRIIELEMYVSALNAHHINKSQSNRLNQNYSSEYSSNKEVSQIKKNYKVDDILDEINKNGIENVDKDKLDYLRNNKNV
ncbi:MAG: hypothetical protein ACOC3V_04175 [bacterium]